MPQQGINIGGDGMGGRRGASRGWAFGNADEADEAGPLGGGGARGGSGAGAGSTSHRPAESVPRSQGGSQQQQQGGSVSRDRLYEQGLQVRQRVMGRDVVEASLRAQEGQGSEVTRAMVGYATEAAWGMVWTRPGLDLKTRSMINLGMLTALGKWTELAGHIKGAVHNGASEVEIREALIQAAAYCGIPAGMEAARVADRTFEELRQAGEL